MNNETSKILINYPYHPYEYKEIWKDHHRQIVVVKPEYPSERWNEFISQGLTIDEDYNVFVHPEYGAFFGNSEYDSMDRIIELSEEVAKMMAQAWKVYTKEEAFLDYLQLGYEFVIGPSITVNGEKSSYGIYCSNYNKTNTKSK